MKGRFFTLSLLHVRGGVSKSSRTNRRLYKSSPRPWRCFHQRPPRSTIRSVFSTSVEVFLKASCLLPKWTGLLHVRGGVSNSLPVRVLPPESSPRPWRCFCRLSLQSLPYSVFSTSVEVFPVSGSRAFDKAGLLHVRGGVSMEAEYQASFEQSSPRPWRCFPWPWSAACGWTVFSTSVEVFPIEYRRAGRRSSLLHVRGGVSETARATSALMKSSPRPWRCFSAGLVFWRKGWVFSTSVEVFPCRGALW